MSLDFLSSLLPLFLPLLGGALIALLVTYRPVISDALRQAGHDTVADFADTAVRAAEQLYLSGQLPPSERKERAIELLADLLDNVGVALTPESVEAFIESAVRGLESTAAVKAYKYPALPTRTIPAPGSEEKSA